MHMEKSRSFLNLETAGVVPLKCISAQRRINYLKHILNQDDRELIKKLIQHKEII